jgi:hypothetical protein
MLTTKQINDFGRARHQQRLASSQRPNTASGSMATAAWPAARREHFPLRPRSPDLLAMPLTGYERIVDLALKRMGCAPPVGRVASLRACPSSIWRTAIRCDRPSFSGSSLCGSGTDVAARSGTSPVSVSGGCKTINRCMGPAPRRTRRHYGRWLRLGLRRRPAFSLGLRSHYIRDGHRCP